MSLACNLRINCSPLPQNLQLCCRTVAAGHAHKFHSRLLKWKLCCHRMQGKPWQGGVGWSRVVPHVLIAWPLSCHLHKIIVKEIRWETKVQTRKAWQVLEVERGERTTTCNKVILSSNVQNAQTWRNERHWQTHEMSTDQESQET